MICRRWPRSAPATAFRAIQLVGWNDGGQDQGNPSHDPDPRLGTFDELQEAIARCHALGVKIMLFAKFTWSDRATKRFREDLHRLAIKDPYGDYYHYQGYQYQTATQLLDINTKRLIPMCFLSEEYLRVCDEEFHKTVELGAAGILFDECLHHSPALLCFDPSHGHRTAAPVYANDRKLIQNFGQHLRAGQPGLPVCRRGVLRLGDGGVSPVVSSQREQAAHPAHRATCCPTGSS